MQRQYLFYTYTSLFSVKLYVIAYFFNRWIVGVQAEFTSFKLIRDLPSSQTGAFDNFYAGDRFLFGMGSLSVGYQVFRNNWLRISPYATIGGGSLANNYFSEGNRRDREFAIFNSFIVGAGLRAEFRLINFNFNDPFLGTVPSGIGIRLDAGTNLPTNFNYTPARGHIPYVRASLVWWFTN